MVEVFKTDVRNKRQSLILLAQLTTRFSTYKINFDLTDCDRILRVEGENISVCQIIECLSLNGCSSEVLY